MTVRLLSLRVMFPSSLLFGILILASASALGQTDKTQQVFDQEDAYLAESTTHSFRGAVLVRIDGKIAFEKGYGLADEEWAVRNMPTTKFRIASLAKQFTLACILLLQERGQLNVQNPIAGNRRLAQHLLSAGGT